MPWAQINVSMSLIYMGTLNFLRELENFQCKKPDQKSLISYHVLTHTRQMHYTAFCLYEDEEMFYKFRGKKTTLETKELNQ